MSNVLVVSDRPDDRQLLLGVLRESGYNVCLISEGGEVIGRIVELRPLAIVIDAELGQGNGAEVCRACGPTARSPGCRS